MNRGGIALALVAGAMLGSCGALDPYPTTPRETPAVRAGLPPTPTAPGAPSRVGICYNSLTTTLDEARKQAQGECPANTVAEQTDSDWYLQYCPVLLPTRATFTCSKGNSSSVPNTKK